MEELFLGPFLAGKELDIIDEQGIYRAHTLLEGIDGVVLQGLDHFGHEAFGMKIEHLVLGLMFGNKVADGVEQMGLAQAGAAIDEQGIIGLAGGFTDLHAGSPGQLIGFSLHIVFEGEIPVDVDK